MTFEFAAVSRRPGRILLAGLAILLVACATALPAFAQSVRSDLVMTNGQVNAEVAWGGKLYIGGSFTNVGPRTGGGVPVDSTGGLVVPGFPIVTGTVNAVVPDGADGWFVGGSFTSVGGQPRSNLAHVLADLSVAAWDPSPNQPVYALAYRAGVVYAGGDFSSIGGQSRARVAALDGTTGLATAWNPGADGRVRAIVADPAVVYLGGDFANTGGSPRGRIAAIDPGTGVATAWNPGSNGSVFALASSGSLVYAGGFFSSIGGQIRIDLAALDATTGLATSWNPRPDNQVFALSLFGSRLYVGGAFTKFNAIVTRNRIAALDVTTGVPDPAFNPNANGVVTALYASGSTVYAGGGFTTIAFQPRTFAAAVDAATGSLTAWNPGAYGSVNALAPGGSSIYVGGAFSGIGGAVRNNVAQIDLATGDVTAWDPNANGQVFAFVPYGSRLFVGGQFSSIGGQPRNNLAALDVPTGLATAWDPNVTGGANPQVSALALDRGVIYAGGLFTTVAGSPRSNLAAVDTTTGGATAWNPGVDGQVFTIANSGNAVYIGGFFFTVAGQTRDEAAAIDATSAALLPWNPNSNGTIRTLIPTCGAIFAGGFFTSIGGQSRNRIAQLDLATGNATSWNADADGPTLAMALTGGALYASGLFSTIGGAPRPRLAAIDPSTALASPWNPGADNLVRAFAIADTTIYIGGAFSQVAGTSVANLAGLSADATLTCPALALAPSSLPDGRAGVAYAQTVVASGGTPPYCYAVTQGALPTGLALDPSSGQIAGTPTVVGAYSFRVTASTVAGCKASRTYAVTILPACPAIAVVPALLPAGHLTAPYSVLLAASAGTAPFTFAVTAGVLPSGITLSPAGLLSGTPTALGVAGFTVTISDSSGCTGSTALSIAVFPACAPIAIAPELPADGAVGAAYDQAFVATGGHAPYAWSLASGTLPAGLALDAGTGHVTGTPTAADTAAVVLAVVDSTGCTGSAAYTFAIFATAPGSFVAANTTGLMITNGRPCTRVPVDLERTIPDEVSAFHLVVQLDAAHLKLCTPALPDSSIRPGAALDGLTNYTFAVTARGAGAYAIDLVFAGTPCGFTTSGALVTLDLAAADGDVPGTIAVTAFRARGCDGAILPVEPGAPATLGIDRAPLALSPAIAPGGSVGDPYLVALATNAGTAPFTWTTTSGTLPDGVTLDSSTGILSGTPTTVQTASFEVTAVDVYGRTGVRSYGVPVFATAPTSLVAVPASGLCLTDLQPFASVPFDFNRTDATPTRVVSVTFQLDPARLRLRTPATPAASVHLGTWASGFGNSTLFTTDNGGGSYTVDVAILGLPCGPSTGGRLFTVDVAPAGPDGPAQLTIVAVRARDCSNVPIAVAGSAPATIAIDHDGAAGVHDLTAAQQAVDGATTFTTRIRLDWTGTSATTNLYRAPRGAHPLYAGAATRPDSSLVPGGPWVHVATNPAPGYVDQPATRGVWCYVLAVTDSCGATVLSNETGGTLDYFLADVSDEVTPATGNNSVNVEDVSLLGAHYGLTGAGAVDPYGYLDVGPTADGTAFSRPLPDHAIDFEDLFVFATSYGTVTGPPAATIELAGRARPAAATGDGRDRFSVEGPSLVDAGEEVTAVLHLAASARMQGFSARLSWDPTVLQPTGWSSAGLLEGQGGLVLSPRPGTLDAAVLGLGRDGIAGEGDVARVTFRALKGGLTGLALASVDARDPANRHLADIQLSAALAAPARTLLLAPSPNPAAGDVAIAFTLAHAGPARLSVYAVNGRLVRTLAQGPHPAGDFRLAWDGKGDDGRLAAAGVYYFHLDADGRRSTRTVVLLR